MLFRSFSQIKGSIEEVEKVFDVSQLESWDFLKDLFQSLENRGVSNIRINFGIVRGLDYYSGTVFEVFDKNSSLGALAGGGRYDTLTKAFGRDDLGATGVAGGIERIILTMEEQKIIPQPSTNKISVVYVNEAMQNVANSIASLLRLNKIQTEIDITGRNMKKQMENASTSKFVIIVGPQELEDGNVTLRNMINGSENTLSIEELTEDPRKFLI